MEFTGTPHFNIDFEWSSTYVEPLPSGMSANQCLAYLEKQYGEAPERICLCVAKNGNYQIIPKNKEQYNWAVKLREFRSHKGELNCSGDYVRK